MTSSSAIPTARRPIPARPALAVKREIIPNGGLEVVEVRVWLVDGRGVSVIVNSSAMAGGAGGSEALMMARSGVGE